MGYIQHLRGRVEELEAYRIIAKRVEMIERSHFKHLQYNRRESIEIAGIPDSVNDKDLENKSLQILGSIGVDKVEPWQVHACHRLKNKRNTIIRFISRKTADSALYKRGDLKKIDKTSLGFPADTKLYINENLYPPLKFLHYKVRQLFKRKCI